MKKSLTYEDLIEMGSGDITDYKILNQDLRNIDFENFIIKNTSFAGSIISRKQVEYMIFHEMKDFRKIKVVDEDLSAFRYSLIDEIVESPIIFSGVDLSEAIFVNTNMDGVCFYNSKILNLKLESCSNIDRIKILSCIDVPGYLDKMVTEIFVDNKKSKNLILKIFGDA